jgi:hypothetical protein
MKKIVSITVEKMDDEWPDTSWLGTYDMEAKTEYAIPTKRDWPPRAYPWFNPPVENYEGETPENIRKYAQQDFERIEAFNKGEYALIGIRAKAEIHISSNGKEWIIQSIISPGIWGIDSDSDNSYFKEVAESEISELKFMLKELGFSQEELDQVSISNLEE